MATSSAPCDLPLEEPLPEKGPAAPYDVLPSLQQPEAVLPLSAGDIHSAEFQFGAAGRCEHVRALVAEGRLRRLPGIGHVEPAVAHAGGVPTPPVRR